MKTFTLISVIVVTCIAGIQAQETEKVFPTSDAIWSVYFVTYGPTEQYIYGLTGDTLINNKEYSKLYLLNDSTLTIDEKDIYVGGIRQEDKIVYMQPATNIMGKTLQEYVLYDFSKTTGEYVTIGRVSAEPHEYHPTFEDVVYMGIGEALIEEDIPTEYGRKITIQSREEWIENIGGLNGFFFQPLTFALDGKVWWFGGILGCMKQDGEIKYLDEYYCDSCFGPLAYDPNLSVENKKREETKVFYNKNAKSIEIDAPLNALYFELFCLQGTAIINTQNTTTISATGIHPGVYLYRLTVENTIHTGKLIINH